MSDDGPLSPLEFHLLAALAEAPSYGYALVGAVERQSDGRLTPDVATLYRAVARLMERGWVEECDAPEDAPESHRGRPRRYYGLTQAGRRRAAEEASRMAGLVDLARRRALFGT